jgi:hypothetical protein
MNRTSNLQNSIFFHAYFNSELFNGEALNQKARVVFENTVKNLYHQFKLSPLFTLTSYWMNQTNSSNNAMTKDLTNKLFQKPQDNTNHLQAISQDEEERKSEPEETKSRKDSYSSVEKRAKPPEQGIKQVLLQDPFFEVFCPLAEFLLFSSEKISEVARKIFYPEKPIKKKNPEPVESNGNSKELLMGISYEMILESFSSLNANEFIALMNKIAEKYTSKNIPLYLNLYLSVKGNKYPLKKILGRAFAGNNSEIIKLLLELEPNLFRFSFFKAIEYGNLEIMTLLLNHEKSEELDYNTIKLAMKYLIEEYDNTNEYANDYLTIANSILLKYKNLIDVPLIKECFSLLNDYNLDMVKIFLQMEESKESIKPRFLTLCDTSLKAKREDIIEHFLKHENTKQTALDNLEEIFKIASSYGRNTLLAHLIENYQISNELLGKGLIEASGSGRITSVRFLLEHEKASNISSEHVLEAFKNAYLDLYRTSKCMTCAKYIFNKRGNDISNLPSIFLTCCLRKNSEMITFFLNHQRSNEIPIDIFPAAIGGLSLYQPSDYDILELLESEQVKRKKEEILKANNQNNSNE